MMTFYAIESLNDESNEWEFEPLTINGSLIELVEKERGRSFKYRIVEFSGNQGLEKKEVSPEDLQKASDITDALRLYFKDSKDEYSKEELSLIEEIWKSGFHYGQYEGISSASDYHAGLKSKEKTPTQYWDEHIAPIVKSDFDIKNTTSWKEL